MSEHSPAQVARARAFCRELGGEWVDLWSAPGRVLDLAARRKGKAALRESAREVVSIYLLEAVASGVSDARGAVVELWQGRVLHWCRWNAGRGVDPMDLAQEVLIRAFNDCHKIQDYTRLRAWLWGIMLNVVREHERKPSRWRWVFGLIPEREDPSSRVDEAIELSERSALVRSILQDMRPELRGLLWQHYVEGLSRAELAELTEIPMGTLNRRLTEARKDFARRAERRGLGPGDLGAQEEAS